jgi:hypothetical protein
VYIKLVVLLRNYVTMMHGQQNIKNGWATIVVVGRLRVNSFTWKGIKTGKVQINVFSYVTVNVDQNYYVATKFDWQTYGTQSTSSNLLFLLCLLMLHIDSDLIGPRLLPAMFPDLLPIIAILLASWEPHSYVPSGVICKANRLRSNPVCSKFVIIFPSYSFRFYTCNAQVFFWSCSLVR